MIVSYHVYTLLIFSMSSSGWCYLYRSPERCGHSLQVLEVQEGEIQSSTYSSWSYRFGPTNDCWVIKGSEEEPVTISFIEFSTRCKKEWLSIKSSAGGDPLILCGSILPKPIAVPGGNITVMHHFLPHDYPSSKFRLRFSRDSYAGECPLSYFECLGGGCLPFSWRCNGQVECLGEGEGRGTDEEGCVDASVSETLHFGSTGVKSPQNEKEPVLTPAPVKWPCGGLLQTFYGTFSPPAIGESPLYCVWTLDPQDSRPLRLDIQQLVLGRDDTLTVHNREQGRGDVIKIITNAFNYKPVQVESHTGLLSLTYQTLPGSDGSGFNATFHVGSYCPPGEGRCGGSAGGCYIKEQECDGKWDCPETGKDEEGCQGCSVNQFACGMAGQRAAASGRFPGRPLCYPVSERCNYQLYCADGSDERDCTVCQKGTFHCDSDRCVFESWRCDGQKDCKDGTDELNCAVTLPRKVITAATVGSLVCGLLLVIAMGCTCKLYSLRTREYSLFAPISRHEAELIQQQAPPSYGQLIAQGVIPPVEDFPTENPNETSSLSLRGILQLLRQDAVNSPHRRRRPRFIRRAVRRMRRWGLIPRPPTRSSQTANGSQQQTDRAPPVQEQPTAGSSSAVEAVNQPVPQKLGLLVQSEHQHETPPGSSLVGATPVVSPPPPPYAPPAPPAPPEAASNTPPVAVPPSSPSLASIFHTLGLSISLFRASSTNSMLLSASPSFSSSSSDDDVLLIPLSEDTTSEDDVPMLT